MNIQLTKSRSKNVAFYVSEFVDIFITSKIKFPIYKHFKVYIEQYVYY